MTTTDPEPAAAPVSLHPCCKRDMSGIAGLEMRDSTTPTTATTPATTTTITAGCVAAAAAECDCLCKGCTEDALLDASLLSVREGETTEEFYARNNVSAGAMEALYEIKMSGMAIVDRGELTPVGRREISAIPYEEFKAIALSEMPKRCDAARADLETRLAKCRCAKSSPASSTADATAAFMTETEARATAESILKILTNKRNRRGVASLFDVCRGEYERRLVDLCGRGERICLALPSFPVKCFNPLKVSRRMPDLAEMWCLLRVHCLCVEIAAVYAPAAYVQLITDGQVYAPIFQEPMQMAMEYRYDLERSITALGIADTVRLVDMYDLVAERSAEYMRERPAARDRVLETWKNHPKVRDALVANTMGNINTLGEVTTYRNAETLAPVVCAVEPGAVTAATHPYDALRAVFLRRASAAGDVAVALEASLRARAEAVALEYATFLETIFAMNVVMTKYPRALRVTCHPKQGQLGLHMIHPNSFNYPWNGVAVLYRSAASSDHVSVRVRFEDEVRREDGFVAVHVTGDPFPFYYEQTVESNVRRRNKRKSGKRKGLGLSGAEGTLSSSLLLQHGLARVSADDGETKLQGSAPFSVSATVATEEEMLLSNGETGATPPLSAARSEDSLGSVDDFVECDCGCAQCDCR